jgi:hypothetical protein
MATDYPPVDGRDFYAGVPPLAFRREGLPGSGRPQSERQRAPYWLTADVAKESTGNGGGSRRLNAAHAVQAASSRSSATRRAILASSTSGGTGAPPPCWQLDDVLLGGALHLQLGPQFADGSGDLLAH